MITPTELQIEQLDGSVETFYIAHANVFLEQFRDKFPPGEHEYRIYKSSPMTALSIILKERANNLFIKHIYHNSPIYEKKNIVFKALHFIADLRKAPIFSSLREDYYNDDDSDRLMPETMGARWEKMMKRYPDRVKFLADRGRYVFLPDQASH